MINEIVENIRLELFSKSDDYVKNKDVAEAIGMSQQKLAVCIHRNSIPYKNIVKFCIDENVDIHKIFNMI